MILQSLVRYYDYLLDHAGADSPDGGLARYGYSPEKISYEILLAADGTVRAVRPTLDMTGKKPRPQLITVPQPEKRTAGIKSNFLWDKSSYVLGVSATSKRVEREHADFKALHFDALAGETDAGLCALVAFLRQWQPEQFQPPIFPEEMKDTNVVFRLEGENRYLHDRPAAQAVRARLLPTAGAPSGRRSKTKGGTAGSHRTGIATCLVTGEQAPAARLHPVIKGVQGAQSSGASIVSFNQEAFASFGKEQGDNAPISERAAFAYTTVLNHLLRRSPENRQRIQIGDASVVFWAEASCRPAAEAAENLLADFFGAGSDDDAETAKVRSVLEAVSKGRPLDSVSPDFDPMTRIFVLGLAPNASRLSVRFWLVDSLQHLVEKLAWHERDLRIEPSPWMVPPAARRLVLATVPNREGAKPKVEDGIQNLIGETLRAILTGNQYPLSLLSNTVMRIRSDGNISGLRVALCKAVLTRRHRLLKQTFHEEIPVSLDKQSTQPAYLLGRLFAVLEETQRNALGGQINATIRDRYYGAASATPNSIFPVLLRNTQNHLAKLRKEQRGRAITLERQIRAIIDGLPPEFPRSFKIEDQGRFAIGYYHQSKARFAKADSDSADGHTGTSNHDETEQGESA